MIITPRAERMGELLSLPNHFVVPKYQRPYKWGKSEAIEFIEDLKGYTNEIKSELFLGTMIFDVSELVGKKINVVDGQQRLTTTLILLIACREHAKKIKSIDIAPQIQQKITFVDPTNGRSLGCRLMVSESIRETFECMAGKDWDGTFLLKNKKGVSLKKQINRLQPIFNFFAKEIADFDEDALSKFLGVIYGSYSVRIDIEDVMQAFSIFERTNARGVDLEASDLLKNYLFSAGVEDLEESWAQIVECSDGTMIRMLKYFYVSRKGHVLKSALFTKLKKYSSEVTPAGLVTQLSEFAQFYNVIRKGTQTDLEGYFDLIGCTEMARDRDKFGRIKSAIDGLRLFKIAQIYPVINAALGCFVRTGCGENATQSKILIQLFETIENYHFINNAVCARIGNEVEKLYADYCAHFSIADDFQATTNKFIKQLKEQLAAEGEFVSRFTDISYGEEDLALLAYIFDRINNHGLAPGQRIAIFDPNPNLQRRNHNIEHIFPRNPKNGDPLGEVNSIGNLLAISFRTNSKLGQKTPYEKRELLTGKLRNEVGNLIHVLDFISTYGEMMNSWDDAAVLERANSLANIAYNKVWKII